LALGRGRGRRFGAQVLRDHVTGCHPGVAARSELGPLDEHVVIGSRGALGEGVVQGVRHGRTPVSTTNASPWARAMSPRIHTMSATCPTSAYRSTSWKNIGPVRSPKYS